MAWSVLPKALHYISMNVESVFERDTDIIKVYMSRGLYFRSTVLCTQSFTSCI